MLSLCDLETAYGTLVRAGEEPHSQLLTFQKGAACPLAEPFAEVGEDRFNHLFRNCAGTEKMGDSENIAELASMVPAGARGFPYGTPPRNAFRPRRLFLLHVLNTCSFLSHTLHGQRPPTIDAQRGRVSLL